VLDWTKPFRCDNSGPNCVEVAADPLTGMRFMRASDRPGEIINVTAEEWAAFEESVRDGQQF
jgi:Domain of unknown function (DUF397)